MSAPCSVSERFDVEHHGRFQQQGTLTYRTSIPVVLFAALLPVATTNARVGDLLKQGQNAGDYGTAARNKLVDIGAAADVQCR
jgi:hypothetical protein